MHIAADPSIGQILIDRLASSDLATAMEKWASPIPSPANDIIFRQGDEPEFVYYLKTGEVILTMEGGDKIIMTVCVPAGSLLGLPAVMGNKPYSLTATAVGQAEVLGISADDFKRIIVQEGLCFDVVRILAGEVHSARVALSDCLNRRF